MKRIGWIGLGNMGLPMASNLLKKGFDVIGFDLNEEALARFRNIGGKSITTLEQLECDALITMLNTGEQVESICLQEKGLYSTFSSPILHIDTSTVSPDISKKLHDGAKKYGHMMVDAPVSGGMKGATQASLSFMVGGEASHLEKARPLLLAMGQHIWHMGPSGSGSSAKLCNNMMLAISMIGTSETFLLAKRLGLKLDTFAELLNHASGQSWVSSQYAPLPGILKDVPANTGYQPGFSVAMMLKDLRLAKKAADDAGFSTTLGEKALSLYESFYDEGHAALDFSAIIKMLDNES